MPQAAVRGPFGKFNLGHQLGPYPDRAAPPFPGHIGIGVIVLRQLVEHFADLPGKVCGEAGADAAGIDQLFAVIKPEQQSADSRAPIRGSSESTDHEFLALLALGLKPGLAASLVVRRIDAFGDHSFQMHAADVLQKVIGIFAKICTEKDVLRVIGGSIFRQQFLESIFPFPQRLVNQAVPVKIKQIEKVILQATRFPLR